MVYEGLPWKATAEIRRHFSPWPLQASGQRDKARCHRAVQPKSIENFKYFIAEEEFHLYIKYAPAFKAFNLNTKIPELYGNDCNNF